MIGYVTLGTNQFDKAARFYDQLLAEISTGTQFVSPDEVAGKIISKDPSIQLIDVRNPRDFDMFSLPGAVNVPLQDILSPEHDDLLN